MTTNPLPHRRDTSRDDLRAACERLATNPDFALLWHAMTSKIAVTRQLMTQQAMQTEEDRNLHNERRGFIQGIQAVLSTVRSNYEEAQKLLTP